MGDLNTRIGRNQCIANWVFEKINTNIKEF